MFPLAPSDVALIIDFTLAIALLLYFSLGRPRSWVYDELGWVIFSYALATVALLGLIVYGIVFGQSIAEPIRAVVAFSLAAALVGKIRAVYRERREGRLAGTASASKKGETMSTPNTEEVKGATVIWYKAQRVLRTIVAVGIPAFLGFAVVMPQIITALGLPADSALQLWLLGAAAVVTAVAGAITRVMAIPAVNAWLIKIGLGSVPQAAIKKDAAGVIVKRDPKATT